MQRADQAQPTPTMRARQNIKNVLKENVFTTDMDALEANDDLRIKFYIDDGSAPPASTWIGCTCLAAPGLMLEIECIAQLD